MMHKFFDVGARQHAARRPGIRFGQRGLTLIEFMVAIALGMMIVAALTVLIAQQSATQSEFEKSSRQIENGRYAMQILNDEIQLAGYYGEFFDVESLDMPGGPDLPDPCSTDLAAITVAIRFAVQGYDSPASPLGLVSCINPANHVPGTDILVIRRAAVVPVTLAIAASGADGQAYLQSGTLPVDIAGSKKTRFILGKGSDTPGTTVFNLEKRNPFGSAFLRKLVVQIYFISPCSSPVGATCTSAADDGKPIPTLKVVELTAAGGATTFTTTPLVEGIENMQIDYGFDTTVALGGDGVPDGQFVSKAPVLASWADLMAMRVHLLARNNEQSPGYTDNKTYTLGYKADGTLQQVTAGAGTLGFKRRVFSQSVRMVNPSGRREK